MQSETETPKVHMIDLLNLRHGAAMDEMSGEKTGINIHGKMYKTVARRVEAFRRNFGVYGRLRISDSQIGDNGVRMVAVVELRTEDGWELVAEGRAEEVRTERGINSTSALEVCETSAYGRALANFGLHGGEFASANEVEHAIEQQNGGKKWVAADTRQATDYKKRIMAAAEKGDDRAMLEVWTEAKQDHEFAIAVWTTLPRPIKNKLEELTPDPKGLVMWRRMVDAEKKNDDGELMSAWNEACEDHEFAGQLWETLPKTMRARIKELKESL
jgi:hypothetical protein